MRYTGLFIGLCVFVFQAMVLPRVGMTWDEPSDYLIGRANMKFWQTGDRKYLDEVNNPAFHTNEPMVYTYGAQYYPPFSFTFASFVSHIISEWLHLVTLIDGYHLGGVILGTIGVAAFWYLLVTIGLTGNIATITTLIYALYPTIFGQMRNDIKDVPLTSMMTVAMLGFVKTMSLWKKHRRSAIRWGIIGAVALGWAAGVKPTAFLVIIASLMWLVLSFIRSRVFRQELKPYGLLVCFLMLLGLLALLSFLSIWPWLWDAAIEKIELVWDFFSTVGVGMPVPYFGKIYFASHDVPWHYPLGILAIQTPIEIVFLAVVGMFVGLWQYIKGKSMWPLLFILWFWVGIGRFFIPHVVIYAKVRQFLESMPAFFVLVGIGLEQLRHLGRLSHLQEKTKKLVPIGVGIVIIIHLLIIDIRFFPYEPSYFNLLVGGTKGVTEKRLFDAEYWASGVKEGMEYVNSISSEGNPTSVYACGMKHLAVNYAAPYVRVTDVGEDFQYALIPHSFSWFGYGMDFYKQFYKPVYVIKRAGAELFYVYKKDNPMIWRCGYESPMTGYGIKE